MSMSSAMIVMKRAMPIGWSPSEFPLQVMKDAARMDQKDLLELVAALSFEIATREAVQRALYLERISKPDT